MASEIGIGLPFIIRSSPITPTLFAVGGKRSLRLFSFDEETQKLSFANVSLGALERRYTDIKVLKF